MRLPCAKEGLVIAGPLAYAGLGNILYNKGK